MISFFLPVRKGSKRIKNKNTKKIGKYKFGLLEIKIKQFSKLRNRLKNIRKFSNCEFIISTDCKTTIRYCNQFKWIRIHNRTPNLSGDHSLQKLIEQVPKIVKKNIILWTHVTSPLFKAENYIDFINFYLKQKKNFTSQSAFTCETINKFVMNEKNEFISHNEKKIKWPRTQDLKKMYLINSAAFIATKEVYIKNSNRLCKKPMKYECKNYIGFDIDDNDNFLYFSNLIKKNFFKLS